LDGSTPLRLRRIPVTRRITCQVPGDLRKSAALPISFFAAVVEIRLVPQAFYNPERTFYYHGAG